MDYNNDDREKKKQFEYPSAGCVFKNDYETNTHAGKLIDEMGFKNYSIGGASVYSNHANFIINQNGAKAKDVLAIVEMIKKSAMEIKNINLDLELKLYGNFGDDNEYANYSKLKKKK